jgi:2-polyprenyl-3-methyl-5-hydroxy-6-metoxy-1,4-benzoquinol methylase
VFEGHEGIALMRCGSCGLVFHDAFTDEAELREYYDGYYHGENLAFSAITDRRFGELLRSFDAYRRSNYILDVGCGSGHFLKVAIEMGWHAHGTEIASSAFEQLSRLGINSFCGKLESANYPDDFFDVVYCSEVIEHLLDPMMLLGEIARILRPGGLLYLTTPNFNSLSRRLLGSRWRVIAKEHICYFTPGSLERALREAGFAKVAIVTRNIDPNEIKRAFSRNSDQGGTGFQTATTEALRHQLETRPALKLAKRAANLVLRTTATGDTIVVRAER